MNKYDTSVHIKENDSLSYIISKISPGSDVLELGPATGYMTKYLLDQLHCKVSIVEIDKEAFQSSMQYAETGICANLEDRAWIEYFSNKKFDYITFADVLEHLKNPLEVLKSACALLKPTGRVLLSIPNIAHNAVLIDLFNNKFEYRETGILDNSHLHFFTRSSIHEMIKACGLCIIDEDAVKFNLEYVGFHNSFSDVPDNLSRELKLRNLGFVNQFLYELSLPKEPISYQQLLCDNITWKSCLYYDLGQGFTEEQKIYSELCLTNNFFKVCFKLPGFEKVAHIKINICDFACVISTLSVEIDGIAVKPESGNHITINGKDIFLSDMPYYAFQTCNVSSIQISGELKNLEIFDAIAALEYVQKMFLKKQEDLENEVGRLNDVIKLKDIYLAEQKIYIDKSENSKKFEVEKLVAEIETLQKINTSQREHLDKFKKRNYRRVSWKKGVNTKRIKR